jgi:putative ABC transport system permease protein
MHPSDLLRFSLSALWRQKVRSLLTLGGVIAGAFLLVVSISIGHGVEDATVREFRRHGELRHISVFPGVEPVEKLIPPADLVVKGPMSEAKRGRIRQGLIRSWPRHHTYQTRAVLLTNDRIQDFARLPHVQRVYPAISERCRASWAGQTLDVYVSSPDPVDTKFRGRLVAGGPLPPTGRYVLVHEFLLYLWGITRDEDVAAVVGRKLHLEYRSRARQKSPALGLLGNKGSPLSPMERDILESALDRLAGSVEQMNLRPEQRAVLKKVLGTPGASPRPPEQVVFAGDFTIAGVVREWVESTDSSSTSVYDWLAQDTELFLPLATAEELFAQSPRHTEEGFSRVSVLVDHESNVAEVARQISARGYYCYSLALLLEQVRKNILLLSIAAAFLAGMALFVAAVGITNMMLMSVLERTHEIGVLKAVGARDRDIQLIFLAEGFLLGLVGGLIGLLAGWLASFPGDHIARAIVKKQTATLLDQSLFAFPLWLVLGVPLFSIVITTLAAIYPARRAARVDPIQALRHE